MNAHVGSERREYGKIYEEYGFEDKNEAGKRILVFTLSYNVEVINTYFRKKKEWGEE